MGDVKRYTVAPSTLIEVEEGYIVLHSDYAVLESKFKTACTQNKALLSQRNSILARHNALEEEAAKKDSTIKRLLRRETEVVLRGQEWRHRAETAEARLSRVVMWLGWPVWIAFVAGCALVDTLEEDK